MGCTVDEWLGWLPQAIGEHTKHQNDSSVMIQIATGTLKIDWQVLSPRIIGLARIPHLQVSFEFKDLDDDQRFLFMKRFDLYMHRGGG